MRLLVSIVGHFSTRALHSLLFASEETSTVLHARFKCESNRFSFIPSIRPLYSVLRQPNAFYNCNYFTISSYSYSIYMNSHYSNDFHTVFQLIAPRNASIHLGLALEKFQLTNVCTSQLAKISKWNGNCISYITQKSRTSFARLTFSSFHSSQLLFKEIIPIWREILKNPKRKKTPSNRRLYHCFNLMREKNKYWCRINSSPYQFQDILFNKRFSVYCGFLHNR